MKTRTGVLVGAVLGYPVSYFFQSGALRAKLSLGGYVEHFQDVLQSKDLASTAIGVWIATIVIFAFIASVIDGMTDRKKDRTP